MGNSWFRALSTPIGPALVQLDEGREIVARAWGAGTDWALEQLPTLLGDHDDPAAFRPDHPVLREVQRRVPDMRVGRTEAVWEALAPAIIEQKVTGREAFAGFRRLVRRHGTAAPGPAREPGHPAHGMFCPPEPTGWARIPSWEWLKAGVEPARSRTLVTAARRADALERTLCVPLDEADRRLRSLPGIGPWTSAEVRQRAHGDPDAWSDGDYHVPGMITLALVGEALDNDAAREVLEPYRGHRYRVQQLVELAGIRPERRGPRRTLPTHLPTVI
ncbi:DNA-3-methyladenine glycosylase family protein [Granulicoccus sp. GXG6511]|uniref:DNA-3-methyladenine glycosylase family protein n=1 Tax=Granulicoccus sp. GXG6511 TaxID=3381351 RepID=UPI003D7E2190